MSKAVAAGLPMGVCAARGDVMNWEEGAHENTLGGNPIVAAAALAVIRVLTREKLFNNAEYVGGYILKRLNELKEMETIIGDVRGKGLMIGVELVKDIETKVPATEARDKLILTSFKKGLLLLGAGRSSIRLAPPLILTREQADIGLDIFESSLKKVSAGI